MIFKSGFEGIGKLNAAIEEREKKSIASKTSLRNRKSEEEVTNPKRPKSSSACESQKFKTNSRVRSKTEDGNDVFEKNKTGIPQINSPKPGKRSSEKNKLNTDLKKKTEEESHACAKMNGSFKNNENTSVAFKTETNKASGGDVNIQVKVPLPKIPRLTGLSRENLQNTTGTNKPKPNLIGKKPSEIPKLKPIIKVCSGVSKTMTASSKLPLRTASKEPEEQKISVAPGTSKKKPESAKMAYKIYKEKKVKDSIKDDFTSLVPFYESELRKITQVWVNTIYCSLTMRANLVKLLFQILPNINKSQFQTEDEKLLQCFSQTKNFTKSESENVVQFIRSLMTNRDAAKDQYSYVLDNEEVAERYNYEWRKLSRKLAEVGEKAKQLQIEIPDLQKKKDAHSLAQREKIKNRENNIAEKDQELQNLIAQLNNLKQKESAYRGSVLLKAQDYREIKADVMSLKAMESEFQELKAKFLDQNETYEKKIKNLEFLLEEKKKVLEKEKEIKRQLQTFLNNLQAQQKKLTFSVGREQVEYVLGKSKNDRDKRREELWVAAVKLVLKGFLIQMKKLEKDRNKMLLELQSNDTENFTTVASLLVKKDNFMKSIKHQINDIQKACKY